MPNLPPVVPAGSASRSPTTGLPRAGVSDRPPAEDASELAFTPRAESAPSVDLDLQACLRVTSAALKCSIQPRRSTVRFLRMAVASRSHRRFDKRQNRVQPTPHIRRGIRVQLTKRALVIGDTEKGAREWGQRAKSGGGYRSNCRTGERPFAQYWPFPASPCRRAVNQKGREFVVR